jgi:ABC-type transport system involved in multi-copper enzyme maturation permease subunit
LIFHSLLLSLSLSLSLCFFAIFIFSYATQYPISLSKNDTILKKAKMTERIALKGALSLVQINTHTHKFMRTHTTQPPQKKIISFLNPKKLNRHVLTLIFDFFKKTIVKNVLFVPKDKQVGRLVTENCGSSYRQRELFPKLSLSQC